MGFEDNIMFSYKENSEIKLNDLDLINYMREKKPRQEYTYQKLKNDKVYVFSESSAHPIDKWSIYNCIITEIESDECHYVLTLGRWYLIDKEYISSVNSFIERIDNYDKEFIAFDECLHGSENDYNQSVSDNNPNILCMDRVNVHVDNGKFELCDLLTDDKHLIHVKPWKSSSTLSHLFSQGRISAETIINFPKEIPQINKLILKQDRSFPTLFDEDNLSPRDYTVVYAIIYKESKRIHERIPFFSKLNLVHSVKMLRAMQFNVKKMQIEKISNS